MVSKENLQADIHELERLTEQLQEFPDPLAEEEYEFNKRMLIYLNELKFRLEKDDVISQ